MSVCVFIFGVAWKTHRIKQHQVDSGVFFFSGFSLNTNIMSFPIALSNPFYTYYFKT